MLIHDDTFHWEGWGGVLRLARGKCRLRIFDLEKNRDRGVTYLRPIVVVVSDVAGSKMSVRACSGHIATQVARQFGLDPQRMQFVEFYPATTYGGRQARQIAEKYDAVDFIWHEDKALHPKWRPLKAPLLDMLRAQMRVPKA